MANTKLNTRIRQRIDTTANWTTNSSTVLANGEMGFERTTSGEIKFKVGDGVNPWSQLSYVATSSPSQSSQGGGDGNEIYIGTTEPTGYKVWINPDGDDDIASSFIIPLTITFDANNEPVFSSTITFSEVLAQYNNNANIKCQGTVPILTGNATIDMPLISKATGITDGTNITVFQFGQFINEEFIVLTFLSNNTWSYEKLEIGGSSFEVGNNMLLENGVLKARYGELYTSFGSLYTIDENTESDGPDTYIEFDTLADLNLAVMMLYNLNNSYPIITAEENSSTPVNLIIHYEDNTTKVIETAMQAIELAEGAYYAGDVELVNLMDMESMESEEQQEFLTYIQNHPNSYLFVNLKTVEDGQEITQIILLMPLSWMASENDAEFVGIEVEGEKTVPYPIPASALCAGKGISINQNNNTINVNYGEKIREEKKSLWTIYSGSTQSSPWFQNWYGWTISQTYLSSSLSNIENNTLPTPLINLNEIAKINWYYKSDKNDEEDYLVSFFDLPEQTNTTIDYTTDSYYYTNIYYGDLDDDDYGYEKIECKQLPYNNPLYNLWSDIIPQTKIWDSNTGTDIDGPSPRSIFFWGSYNCQEDFNTAISTLTLTPSQNDKDCFGICILVVPEELKLYFTVISPNNTCPIDNHKELFDFRTIPIYKTISNIAIPSNQAVIDDVSIAIGARTQAYNRGFAGGGDTIANSNSIVFGQDNIDKGHSNAIFGSQNTSLQSNNIISGYHNTSLGSDNIISGNNNISKVDNSLTIGWYNKPNSDALFTIGCGWQDHRANSFEIKNDGQAFFIQNDTYYPYWNSYQNKLPNIKTLSQSATLDDVITAYNTLIQSLINRGLMENSTD